MRYVIIAMLLFLIWLDPNLAQAANADDLESLRGLPGVRVTVDKLELDGNKNRLSTDEVRSATELILRANRIQVLTDEQFVSSPVAPILTIVIATAKDPLLPSYVVFARTSLNQRSSLYGSQKVVWATTWKREWLGMVGASRMQDVTTSVESQIKQFANDFLVANPR